MADTQTQSGQGSSPPSGGPPALPPILGGEELYDFLMGRIEPELKTKELPRLKEKYGRETREQKKAREERYAKAFAEYEKQFAAYTSDWEAHLHAFKQAATASLEQDDRTDEEQTLGALEDAMTQL